MKRLFIGLSLLVSVLAWGEEITVAEIEASVKANGLIYIKRYEPKLAQALAATQTEGTPVYAEAVRLMGKYTKAELEIMYKGAMLAWASTLEQTSEK